MGERTSSLVGRCCRESLYLLTSFPLMLVYFVFTVTMVSVSVGTLIIWIGVPLLIFTLFSASGFAAAERGRAAMIGVQIENPPRLSGDVPPSERGLLKNWRRRITDRNSWMAVLHHFVMLPVVCTTWSFLITWWAGALGGLTYWFWGLFLPDSAEESNISLAELLRLPISDSLFYLILGAVFLITLPAVVHGMAMMQASITKALLSPSRRSLERQIASLEQTKTAAVEAELISMRKLERDLHDGPQQRLIRLGMDLAMAERRLDSGDTESARGVINEAKSHVEETLNELRNLSRGIAPPILVDRGLVVALTTLAANATVPVMFETSATEDTRLALPIENAIYFCASEALANIAKHAEASQAWMNLTLGEKAVLLVTDDGRGGTQIIPGHGLGGLRDRAASVGGTLSVKSDFGSGTIIRLEIPLR